MHCEANCQDFQEPPKSGCAVPKEFQFSTSEVFIRKQGDDVILSARPQDWSAYLKSGPVASKEFMEGVEDLPAQKREL